MVSPTHEYHRRHDTASVCHRGDEIRGLNPRRDHMPHEHGKRCHQQCQSGAKCAMEMRVKQVLTARLLTGLSVRSLAMGGALRHSAFPLRNQLRCELSRAARDVRTVHTRDTAISDPVCSERGPLWQSPGADGPSPGAPVTVRRPDAAHSLYRAHVARPCCPTSGRITHRVTHIFLQFIINSSQDISLRPLS